MVTLVSLTGEPPGKAKRTVPLATFGQISGQENRPRGLLGLALAPAAFFELFAASAGARVGASDSCPLRPVVSAKLRHYILRVYPLLYKACHFSQHRLRVGEKHPVTLTEEIQSLFIVSGRNEPVLGAGTVAKPQAGA